MLAPSCTDLWSVKHSHRYSTDSMILEAQLPPEPEPAQRGQVPCCSCPVPPFKSFLPHSVACYDHAEYFTRTHSSFPVPLLVFQVHAHAFMG